MTSKDDRGRRSFRFVWGLRKPGRRRPRRRWEVSLKAALITAGGTVVAALIAACVVLLPKAVPALVTPPPTLFTRVQNTGYVGVFAYAGPSTKTARTRGPQEGDLVAVICQERYGEQQFDRFDPKPDQPPGWTAWDKMSDGRWIPDLWTDLPKIPGDVPPSGLPKCK